MPIPNTTLSLRTHLIRGAFGSLILKLAQTMLTLVLTVILARMLGVEGFGVYAFCLSVVNLLVVPAMLGGQKLLVREVAVYNAKGQYHLLRGLIRRMRQASTGASVCLAFLAGGIGILVYQENPIQAPFLIAMALMPLMTTLELQGSVLRGLHHIFTGQIHVALLPAMVIALFYIMTMAQGIKPMPDNAIIAYVASAGLLVIFIYFRLHQLLPDQVKHARPAFETAGWIKSMLPFVFASGMQVFNREISVILLALIGGTTEAGLFRVAQRGAELIPFGLLAVNTAIAPVISELFARNEKKRLQQMITKSTLAITAFAVPVAILLITGGKWLIPVVFGAEYAQAYLILVILCLGQLFNAFMGSVGLILNMCGHENTVAWGVTVAAAASLVMNLALIPMWGATGAAIATCGSLIVWNILLGIRLYQKTGVNSTILVKIRLPFFDSKVQ